MQDLNGLMELKEHDIMIPMKKSFMSHVAMVALTIALGGACVTTLPTKALALEGETTDPITVEEAQTEDEVVVESDAPATDIAAPADEVVDASDREAPAPELAPDQEAQAVDTVDDTFVAGQEQVVADDPVTTPDVSDDSATASDDTSADQGQTTSDEAVVSDEETSGNTEAASNEEIQDDTLVSEDTAEVVDEASEKAISSADDAVAASVQDEAIAASKKKTTKASAASANAGQRKGHWKVETKSGKTTRYFVWDDDGTIAKNQLVGPDNGVSYWAYATADGSILCGKWDNGAGRVYVADSNGKLIGSDLKGNKSGWVVTGAYDNGTKRRYWVDVKTRAAVTGFIKVDGYGNVYGLSDEGYILCGIKKWGNYVILANESTGKLPTKAGWLDTDVYGQGSQRYWIQNIYKGFLGSKPGFSKAGYDHYTTTKGYVQRGAKKIGDIVVLANSKTGRLPAKAGWLNFDLYGQGAQRYWVETIHSGNILGSKPGFSKGGYDHYTTPYGYVQRGAKKQGNYVILADSKSGKFPTKPGWLESSAFGQGSQRYWVEYIRPGSILGSKPGFSKGGYDHYTTPYGYVQRGAKRQGDYVILADTKTGKLPTTAGWLESSAYGQGSQRYWIEKIVGDFLGSKPGYSEAGYKHFTVAEGYVVRNKQITVNGKKYDATNYGQLLGDSENDVILRKVYNNTNSATQWMVIVDKTNHNIAVLHRASRNSAWEFVMKAKCSIGMAKSPENVTLSGQWTVGGKYYEQTHYGYTDWYHTNVCPLAITQMEIHSVLYSAYSKTRFVDGRLGQNISNGCVRTTLEMAKYIYDRVPPNSRVYVYD